VYCTNYWYEVVVMLLRETSVRAWIKVLFTLERLHHIIKTVHSISNVWHTVQASTHDEQILAIVSLTSFPAKPAPSLDTPSPRYCSASLPNRSQLHTQSPDGSFKCNTLDPSSAWRDRSSLFNSCFQNFYRAYHHMGPTTSSHCLARSPS
jgi:hypothetical protein